MLKLTAATLFLFSLLIYSPALRGQQPKPPPTRAQFKASIAVLKSKSDEWRKLINSVKIEDLPVGYKTGKSYEESRNAVLSDLDSTLMWANYASESGSLFDEVNYLSVLQDLQMQIALFVDLLLDFHVADKAMTDKVQNWALAIGAIGTSSLPDAFTTTFRYTTHHALEADKAGANH